MKNTYNIVEKIYKSNSTEILRAKRNSDDKSVILKIKDKILLDESDLNLYNEYKLIKEINGKRVIQTLDFETYDKKSTIIFSDDKMTSLSELIPENGFDIKTFLTLTIEITSAIEEIHQFNIIHKNINPSNIIVNSALNNIKIIDFKIASFFNEEVVGFEAYSILKGTLSYISPEQTGRVNTPVDLRTDFYSLGVTLYFLLTGTLPFDNADDGELIYSHLAKKMPPINKPDTPDAIIKIIEKLLEKSPNNRYQTAKGILDDLLLVQNLLLKKEDLSDFIPGGKEQLRNIVLSNQLYSRENETRQLFDCFNNNINNFKILTVTGGVGTGKASLIRELHTPITEKKGLLLYGDFILAQKGSGYNALTNILKEFLKQCTSTNEETINMWQNVVQSSVGSLGRVLTNLVPEFETLIGEQQKIATVTPQETSNRLKIVLSNLIYDICAVGVPVVVVFKNLQWADVDTLEIIEKTIDINPKNLMLILSYREDEITPKQPMDNFLQNIKSLTIDVTNINLENISRDGLALWIHDILGNTAKRSDELIDIILSKTEGNPLYIKSFLSQIIDNNYLFIENDGTTNIDINAIKELHSDLNTSEHLEEKIKTLSNEDKMFLMNISILGTTFSLNTIEIFLKTYQLSYIKNLNHLIKSNLIIKNGDTIKFTHNRIQQIAYGMLDEKTVYKLHLQAGKNLKTVFDNKNDGNIQVDDFLFHLNIASDFINDKNEKLQLANLNYLQGKRLKNNAAYQPSENAFRYATVFLPPNSFEIDYDISIDLYTNYGEVLFLNSKYVEGEKQFDKVIRNSKTPLDRANVYVKQIVHYASHHELKKSMNIALYALESLKVKLPKKNLKVSTIINLLKVKQLVKKIPPEQISELPVTKEALTIAQMNVLSAAIVPAYIGFPEYYPIIVLRMTALSALNGNSPNSIFAWSNYAIILCSLGEFDKGFKFGETALRLLDNINAKPLETKTPYMFAFMVFHWKKPTLQSIQYFEKAYQSGIDTGDYEFASYAANNVMHISFYGGKNIEELISIYPEQHKILETYDKKHTISEAKFWNQMLLTLNDPNGDGVTIKGELIDEKILKETLRKQKDFSSLGICLIAKMQLAYLTRDFKLAIDQREEAFTLLDAMTGTMFIPVCHFFSALTCIAYYKNHEKNSKYLREAKKSLKKLKKWGASAPENYLYKAQLVEAELLSVNGKTNKALSLYENAIKNAKDAKNNLDLGIAYECMGRYLLDMKLTSLGLTQIQNSFNIFKHWGAFNKSNRLQKEFSLSEGEWLSTNTELTNENLNDTVNLNSLIGSIEVLSGSLELNYLLKALIAILMKNSGATYASYIYVNNNEMKVFVDKHIDGETLIYEDGGVFLNNFDLPISLIEKCRMDTTKFLLDNISIKLNEKTIARDKIKNKSIFVIPIRRNGELVGIIYLENNLLENAFRKEQVQFLSLLAGQAAISIENAIFFEKLNIERNYSANLVSNSSSMIVGIDISGLTTFINPMIEKVTGYTKNDIINKNWWKLLYPEKEYRQVEALFKQFSSGEVIDYEMTLTTKSGEKKVVEWNSFTLKNDNNEIIEIVGFGNNITDRKRAEEIIESKNKELEQIVYVASHDLRSPLVNVDGFSRELEYSIKDLKSILNSSIGREELIKALQTEFLDMEQSIDRIQSSATQMDKLLKGLLHLSRQGRTTLLTENVDMNKCIAQLSSSFAFAMKEKEVELIVKNLPICHGDTVQMTQVFSNLIDNAIKYRSTERRLKIEINGEIKIGQTVYRIKDNGIGIAENHLNHIFELFHRLEPGKTEGEGLGLTTVRQALSRMYGEIKVESELGKGSIFIVTMPHAKIEIKNNTEVEK